MCTFILASASAALTIAAYTLLPFGHTVVSRADYLGREDIGTGGFGMIGNLIWLVLAGWWLASVAGTAPPVLHYDTKLKQRAYPVAAGAPVPDTLVIDFSRRYVRVE